MYSIADEALLVSSFVSLTARTSIDWPFDKRVQLARLRSPLTRYLLLTNGDPDS